MQRRLSKFFNKGSKATDATQADGGGESGVLPEGWEEKFTLDDIP